MNECWRFKKMVGKYALLILESTSTFSSFLYLLKTRKMIEHKYSLGGCILDGKCKIQYCNKKIPRALWTTGNHHHKNEQRRQSVWMAASVKSGMHAQITFVCLFSRWPLPKGTTIFLLLVQVQEGFLGCCCCLTKEKRAIIHPTGNKPKKK